MYWLWALCEYYCCSGHGVIVGFVTICGTNSYQRNTWRTRSPRCTIQATHSKWLRMKPLLEPKITRTPKKTHTHRHRQKRQTTPPNNLPKWPKHYRTAPSPMTDFSHYLAKNHAMKNVIELKWAPGPRAQYGRMSWGSATVWLRINHGQ